MPAAVGAPVPLLVSPPLAFRQLTPGAEWRLGRTASPRRCTIPQGPPAVVDGERAVEVELQQAPNGSGFGLRLGGAQDVTEARLLGAGVFVSGVRAGSPAALSTALRGRTGWQIKTMNGSYCCSTCPHSQAPMLDNTNVFVTPLVPAACLPPLPRQNSPLTALSPAHPCFFFPSLLGVLGRDAWGGHYATFQVKASPRRRSQTCQRSLPARAPRCGSR